jgi:hypothetical protein
MEAGLFKQRGVRGGGAGGPGGRGPGGGREIGSCGLPLEKSFKIFSNLPSFVEMTQPQFFF